MVGKRTLSALQRLIAEHTQTARLLEEELTRIQSRRNKLDESSRTIGSQLCKENREVQKLQEQIIVRSRLPQRVLKLRSQLLETKKAIRSVDITIKKQSELRGKIEKLSQDLQKACSHPFVFSYDGYGGSRSYDYDDAYCGIRICAVCGLRENSQSTDEDKYQIFISNKTRLIKRDLRKREKQNPIFNMFTFLSIPHICKVFLASVGDRNAVWYEEKTGKKKKEETAENAHAV